MIKIGLLSDTHCTFDDKVRHFFDDVDELWHAGDFGNLETADLIASFKPLIGVYGNCDDQKVRLAHPRFQHFRREGMDILMTHIGGYPNRYDGEALHQIDRLRPQIFISGHSHILKVMYDSKKSLLHLNPGAAGHGYQKVRTALRFIIDSGEVKEMEVGEWKSI